MSGTAVGDADTNPVVITLSEENGAVKLIYNDDHCEIEVLAPFHRDLDSRMWLTAKNMPPLPARQRFEIESIYHQERILLKLPKPRPDSPVQVLAPSDNKRIYDGQSFTLMVGAESTRIRTIRPGRK